MQEHRNTGARAAHEEWARAFAACPLVAILRGVRPDEAEAIAGRIIGAGFTVIEVPLNSPDPLESIRRLSSRFSEKALIGAGTVLTAEDAAAVHDAGGRLIIAPNFNPKVAQAATARGMIYGPGVGTVSEAFAALEAGAAFLKLFPAEMIPPAAVKAMRAVLPKEAHLLPVGGVSPGTMARYLKAGANGFGLGSALYRAGAEAEDVGERAEAFITALKAV